MRTIGKEGKRGEKEKRRACKPSKTTTAIGSSYGFAGCQLRVAGCGLRVMGYGLWVIVTGKEAKVHGIQYAINIRSFDVFNSNVVV